MPVIARFYGIVVNMKDYKTYPLIDAVKPQADKRLLVRFRNGITKLYDCRRILKSPVFEPLRDNDALFRRARADKHGYGVIWNDELDLAESEVWLGGKVVREDRAVYGNKGGRKMSRTPGTTKRKHRDGATADRETP
jgi:hypothetical protein